MVLKLMMTAAFVAKKTQSITLLFTAPLRNNSYKKSFCGSTQRTIHSSLQQQKNFYSELPPTLTRKVRPINSTTSHYLCITISIVVNLSLYDVPASESCEPDIPISNLIANQKLHMLTVC